MTFAKTFKAGDRVQLEGIFGLVQRTGYDHAVVVEWETPGVHPPTVDGRELRHAPVLVIGAARRPGRFQTCAHSQCTAPARVGHSTCAGHAAHAMPCPECGGATVVDEEMETIDPGTRERRPCRVVACTACEFIKEI